MSSTETLERPIEDETQQEIFVREINVSERTPTQPEPGPGDFVIRYSSKFGHIALGPRHHIRRHTL